MLLAGMSIGGLLRRWRESAPYLPSLRWSGSPDTCGEQSATCLEYSATSAALPQLGFCCMRPARSWRCLLLKTRIPVRPIACAIEFHSALSGHTRRAGLARVLCTPPYHLHLQRIPSECSAMQTQRRVETIASVVMPGMILTMELLTVSAILTLLFLAAPESSLFACVLLAGPRSSS